jgi:acetyl esterase/lipase
LVQLINTDPDLADNPWGENEGTPGLTPNRLLGDLKIAFEREDPDFRNHGPSNPWKMPEEVVRMLPRTIMVSAKLDILYKSQVEFKDCLQAQGVQVDWMKVDGLHYYVREGHGPSHRGEPCGEAICKACEVLLR